MPILDRRTMLCAVAGGVLAALTRGPETAGPPVPRSMPVVPLAPGVVGSRLHRPLVPGVGVLTRLPGDGNRIALTVDDGASTSVVAAFAQFAKDSGTRLTFFVNGANNSWSANAPVLRPMVDSGQIQMANHTWSHPYLNRISHRAVADQIHRNAEFLRKTYGTDGRPFFRPPYGVHNADTDRIAADHGYRAIAMWSGDVGDSLPETAAKLMSRATSSFQPGRIVLMHANQAPITHCYGHLLDLIRTRTLQTVTLKEVFG